MPNYPSGQNASTVIAHGVKVEGEFTSQSDVLIEGEVHGSLSTTGMLTVGQESKIKADVKANDALISGVIEGNLQIVRRLDIKATAKIVGDIVCETIAIEAGAFLSGHVQVGDKSHAAETQAASGGRRVKTESVA